MGWCFFNPFSDFFNYYVIKLLTLKKLFNFMKITTPFFSKLILLSFCMLMFSSAYSQGKKVLSETLFGKPIKAATINPNDGSIRCATVEYEQYLQDSNPKRMTEAQFESWINPLVAKYKAMRISSKTAGTIITIPVVVHVIHSGQPIGTAPNITDSQVQSQITVLNEDYRKMAGSPGGTNADAVDVQIQFALALQDQIGNPTNGIDRVSLCQSTWSTTELNTVVKPATIWDPTQYLNMWSVDFSDTRLLGYAQFPSASGLSGLPSTGNASSDGVVASYDVFGSSAYNDGTFLLYAPYDRGRTMTHEVGHWLGLRHIWGDGTGKESKNTPDCAATDYCDDTPQVGWEHYNCGTFDTCPTSPGNDMPENYMDYTGDGCMNIFTQNQKDRIDVVMANADRRSALKNSTKNVAIPLFANDAEVKSDPNLCEVENSCAPASNKKVVVFNRGTAPLTSVFFSYTIGGGATKTYKWIPAIPLGINNSETVTLPSTAAYGVLNVTITKANGVTDQRSTNDTASKTYSAPVSPVNYTFNTFVFRLQRDFFGSETTWSLKDSAGNPIYGGGPYTDTYVDDVTVSAVPALITQTWVLADNQCYTFTINDSQADGICCGTALGGSGDGFYDIKSTDGASVVASGATFTTGVVNHPFSTSILGTKKFEALNDIYLYPNPTKGTLTIHVPSDFGLPNSFTVNNTLGQIISRKVVSKENDLTLNTSALSNGVYFITVVKEDQNITLQFIKE
jgi:hypothetical protein